MLSDAEIYRILQNVREANPRAWAHAHHEGDPERYDYIILAGKRLFAASNGQIGCNWRRAVVGDLSMDGISVVGADGRYYFADVITGAGGSNPQLTYRTPGPEALLRDSAGNYAPHGFADPRPLRTHFPYDREEPPPPPPQPPPSACRFQPLDLSRLENAILALTTTIAELKRITAHAQEAAMDAAVRANEARHAADRALAKLDAGFQIDASARFIGPIRGTVK